MVCQLDPFHLLGANHSRLDAANIIYRDNGCEDLTKYGKIFNFSSWLLHVADLSSDRFPCVQ